MMEDTGTLIKAILIFLVLMIPIWMFNLVDISVKWKLIFTLGAVIGITSKLYLELDFKLHK